MRRFVVHIDNTMIPFRTEEEAAKYVAKWGGFYVAEFHHWIKG